MTDFLKHVAAASAEMANPVKASTNPHFKSKFASLEQTMGVIEPVLAKHKLGHTFRFDGTSLVYIVFDPESNEREISSIDLKDIMNDLSGNVWQSIGQAFTYLRRYLAQAFWNLVPEDDDAQSAPTKNTKLDALRNQVRARASEEEITPKEWLAARGVDTFDINQVKKALEQ